MQTHLVSILQRLTIGPRFLASFSTVCGSSALTQHVPTPNLKSLRVQQVRFNSFKSEPASSLWKSISVVSKAGMRRGRGRKVNEKVTVDLSLGQRSGEGRIKVLFPGLNSRVVAGVRLVRQERSQEEPLTDQERADMLAEIRKQAVGKGKKGARMSPLERGYTSRSIAGRFLTSPPFDLHGGFQYKVLSTDFVCHMSGTYGRVQRFTAIVACGNGNGVIGIGDAVSKRNNTCLQRAANRALKRLIHVERSNDHTVCHDFFTQFYRTKIFVEKKPEGYGLVCHRIIQGMCQLIGIKDLYAKVEGAVNPHNLVKAFLLGLVRQRSFQDMANEKQLHLVEIDKQRRDFPVLLASPEKCRTKEEIPSSESLDFGQLCLGGRVALRKKKSPPFYEALPSWQNHLQKAEFDRGKNEQKLLLKAQYGKISSFLSAKYPR